MQLKSAVVLGAAVILAVGVACESSVPADGGGAAPTVGASSGASGSGTSSSGFGTSASGSSGAGGDAAGPEVCDGVDNDGNGIVDDVDVGGDGVCDCLRIATLGVRGTAGVGDVFAAWLDAKSDRGATALTNQEITPSLLAGYQVIVIQNVSTIGRTYAQSEVDALSGWVNAGGGILTLIGYGAPTERANVNLLLAPFGMSYLAAPILPKSGGSTVPITHWLANHPVTDGISRIGVDNGYEVAGAGTTLATEQNLVLLKGREVTKGHVLVWGDEWITFNSEWNTQPNYQVARFWVNAIKWLTPAKECQVPVPVNVR